MNKNSFQKLLMPFILTTGIAFHSYGIQICLGFYNGVGRIVAALDNEYRRIIGSQSDGTKRASQVTSLLNRAFFPMVEKLSADVNDLRPSVLTFEFQNQKKFGRVLTTGFSKFLGMFGVIPNVNDLDARNAFSQNLEAARTFGLRERSNVVSFSEVKFIDPSTDRIARLGKFHSMFGSFVAPVGDYGPYFSEKMIRTTQLLTAIAEKSLSGLSEEIFSKNSEMLLAEAARSSRAFSERAELKLTPLSSFVEGLLSFQQLVMIILSEKIPGIPTGELALHELIFNSSEKLGLITALTSRIPLGLVGPMTNNGLGFKNTLRLNGRGQLEITEEFKSTLTELMDIQVRNGRRRARCPMAGIFAGKQNSHDQNEKAGLQILAETYWKVFEMVSKLEDQRTGQIKRAQNLRQQKN